MYSFNKESFCGWLKKMNDDKLALHYRVLRDFYNVLSDIDPDGHTIFMDLLDEIEVEILEECSSRFFAIVESRSKEVIRAFECLGDTEKKTKTN